MRYLLGFLIFFKTCVFAVTLPVQVVCSDGQPVPNLSITVLDLFGNRLPDISVTDSMGFFEIVDRENYATSLYVSYLTRDGSSCDYNQIAEIPNDQGYVFLNYYPTELPCSCANLK